MNSHRYILSDVLNSMTLRGASTPMLELGSLDLIYLCGIVYEYNQYSPNRMFVMQDCGDCQDPEKNKGS